ncbi:MAG: ATP-dependent RNA helicase HrpA [Pseudomonadota bacterium]
MDPRQRFQALNAEISLCLRRDQHRLARQLAALRRQDDAAAQETAWQNLAAEITASCERRARRLAALPVPTFPEELPVSQMRDEIARTIAAHQVVIVCGETGSGKTTQLPKICLALGRGVAGLIGHTQPRRIAARSLAARIAEELHTPLGQVAGYQVRFSDQVGEDAYIKVMTDGILLAEIQGDRFLDRYDTLIIDEAHERSLNIDFLLGYLKQLLPKRPDLKVIITSATIDPQRFSKHFNDAPIIEVSGRTHPVELRYRPLLSEDEDGRDRDMQQAILEAVDELARHGAGDVLIFLSGEREIRETAEALRKHHPPHTEIIPLYARLSAADQNKVFQAHGGRRIVLATNVAETSLTVPGIKYVIDPGLVRISRYSHRAKVQRLPIEPVSQASANQRAGRCGRVSAGVCIRLYAEDDFNRRPLFTDPEILRTHLAAVILQMTALGFGDVAGFPFIEPPDGRQVNAAYQTLLELGAVDERRALTKIGRELAGLPVDPRLGRMLLAAREFHCLSEMLVIVAALAVADPRERPIDKQQAADEKHARYVDPHSDFMAYLKLWADYHEQARHLSKSQLRKYCQDNFLSYVRLRDWHDIHAQLTGAVKQLGVRLNQEAADYQAIHRALSCGLLGQIGMKGETQEYLGARGIKFHIFPGSALFKKPPKWLVAGELAETARLYARSVARIEPEWLETLAAHLVKRHYSEPRWEKKPAAVMAVERVTLYGLPIVTGRKVQYGPINPAEARELFIRHALVEGEYETRAPFFVHNQALIHDVEGLEHKVRRHDILVDPEVLYAFYEERLPAGLSDGRGFERWRKEAEQHEPRLLFLSKEYLMRRQAAEITEAQFPDHLLFNGVRLNLDYHFEPGHDADGVTVSVPLALLNQLPAARFEWLVPGLLRDKIIALIKSLPKSLRRNFVPAPNFADACLQAIVPGQGSLLEVLTRQLTRMTGVEIPADAWQLAGLPPHLLMNFKVVAVDGRVVVGGRDLTLLQQTQGERAAASFATLPTAGFEREQITAWDFGDLPARLEFTHHGMQLIGYPALVDEKNGLALRLLDSAEKADKETRAGVCRLFKTQLSDRYKYLEKNLPGLQALCLHYAGVGTCASLKEDILAAITRRAALGDEPPPRSAAEFERRKNAGAAQLVAITNEVCGWVGEALTVYHALAKRLKLAVKPAWLKAANDIQSQLRQLVYPGFVAATPYEQLRHLPRYLRAIETRLTKLEQQPGRDGPLLAQVAPLWEAYLARADKQRALGTADPGLDEFRWLLEELRVSLFAQELKTAVPVSAPRLAKRWAEIKS